MIVTHVVSCTERGLIRLGLVGAGSSLILVEESISNVTKSYDSFNIIKGWAIKVCA